VKTKKKALAEGQQKNGPSSGEPLRTKGKKPIQCSCRPGEKKKPGSRETVADVEILTRKADKPKHFKTRGEDHD